MLITFGSDYSMLRIRKKSKFALLFIIISLALIAAVAHGEMMDFRERWAILIGVGKYRDGNIPPLESPVNDVQIMKEILTKWGEFKDDHVFSLTNEIAIYDAIIGALSNLMDKVQKDDMVIFYFSGRGTRIKNTLFFDPEPDDLDECLLPYNADKESKKNFLRDDDIGRYLYALHAKRTVIIIDSSYSGGGDGKGISSSDTESISPSISPLSLNGITRNDYLPVRTVVIEACRPDETVADGVFTPLLREACEGDADSDKDGKITIEEAFNFVRDRMRFENGITPQLREREYAEGLALVIKFQLKICSYPNGAEIFLNGKLLENQPTPQSLTLSKGSYEIEIRKKGYNSKHKTVEIPSPKEQSINVSLTPTEKPNYLWVWLSPAIAAGVIGGVLLWYHIRHKPDFDKQYFDKQYPEWKRGIDEKLAESGVVPLKSIVPKRQYITFTIDTYIKEADYNLTRNETEISLELENTKDILLEFNNQWKLAQENLENGDQGKFIQAINKITEMLCQTLGFDKVQNMPEQRGNVFAYSINIPFPWSGIPSPLPFTYLCGEMPLDDEFKNQFSDISYGIFITFDDVTLLRSEVKESLFPDYGLIVVDENNIREIFMTKDPRAAFTRTINIHWATIFFERSGCDVNMVEDKKNLLIIEKTQRQDLQEYGRIYIHYSTSANDIEQFRDYLRMCYGCLEDKLAFVILESTELSSGTYHRLSDYRLNEGLIIIPLLIGAIRKALLENNEEQLFSRSIRESLGEENLYSSTDPIDNPLKFYGRIELINELLRNIQAGKHISIFGIRKIGKTSLVWQLRERLSEESLAYPTAYIDIRGTSDCSNIYPKIIESLIKDIKMKYPGKASELSEIAVSLDEPIKNFEIALLRVKKCLSDLIPNFTIFLDEIDAILPTSSEIDDGKQGYHEFLDAIHRLARDKLLTLVIISAYPHIVRVSRWWPRQRDNPMYLSFIKKILSPFDYETETQMIKSIGGKMNVLYEPESLRLIHEESGGHPFISRQLCSCIIQNKKRPVTVSVEDVKEAVKTYVREPRYNNSYFDGLWRTLFSHEMRRICEEIAEASEPMSTDDCIQKLEGSKFSRRQLRNALNYLKELYLIKEENQRLSFTIKLFRRWIIYEMLGLEGV